MSITNPNDGIAAIYVRRSVSGKDKGNNSLPISAQKEECIRFVGECDYRIYCDDGKPDTETESIKTEIIRIDGEIQKLMEKLADADSVLFDYIQKRVSPCTNRSRSLIKKCRLCAVSVRRSTQSLWKNL